MPGRAGGLREGAAESPSRADEAPGMGERNQCRPEATERGNETRPLGVGAERTVKAGAKLKRARNNDRKDNNKNIARTEAGPARPGTAAEQHIK